MTRYADRKWVILAASEADSIEFSQVLEVGPDSLRWNNDSTKTFVKYDGNKPRFLYGKNTLNHAQILAELEGAEWTPSPAPPE